MRYLFIALLLFSEASAQSSDFHRRRAELTDSFLIYQMRIDSLKDIQLHQQKEEILKNRKSLKRSNWKILILSVTLSIFIMYHSITQ